MSCGDNPASGLQDSRWCSCNRKREREQKVFVHCRLRHLFAPLWLQDAKWHQWIHTKILASASAPALAMKGWEGWKATS